MFLGVHSTEFYGIVSEIVDIPENNMAFECMTDHGSGMVKQKEHRISNQETCVLLPCLTLAFM